MRMKSKISSDKQYANKPLSIDSKQATYVDVIETKLCDSPACVEDSTKASPAITTSNHATDTVSSACISPGTFSQVFKDTDRNGHITIRKQLINSSRIFKQPQMKSVQRQMTNEVAQLKTIGSASQENERARKYVVSMSDWDTAEQPQYIRFPLLPGAMDLVDFYNTEMSRKLLCSRAYTLSLMYQLARGLDFLYRLRIAHRDIKHENIIISYQDPKNGFLNPLLQLCDFGYAHSFDTKEEFSRICGTRGYHSWELINLNQAQENSDVFSMGILFFEMINMQHFIELPEKREDYKEAFNQQYLRHMQSLTQKNGRLGDYFTAIIVSMLQSDAKNRALPHTVLKNIKLNMKKLQRSKERAATNHQAATTASDVSASTAPTSAAT